MNNSKSKIQIEGKTTNQGADRFVWFVGISLILVGIASIVAAASLWVK